MPTFGDNLQLTSGSSSANLFANTAYNKVNQGTTIRINLASVSANDGVSGANLSQTFAVGNTVYADAVPLGALVTGQPFSDNGAYKENEVVVTQPGSSIPSLVVKNNTSGSLTFKYKVFVSQQ